MASTQVTYTVQTSSAKDGSDRRTHAFPNAASAWEFMHEIDRSDDRLAGFPVASNARLSNGVR